MKQSEFDKLLKGSGLKVEKRGSIVIYRLPKEYSILTMAFFFPLAQENKEEIVRLIRGTKIVFHGAELEYFDHFAGELFLLNKRLSTDENEAVVFCCLKNSVISLIDILATQFELDKCSIKNYATLDEAIEALSYE